jgi:hypothetical protein
MGLVSLQGDMDEGKDQSGDCLKTSWEEADFASTEIIAKVS